MILDPVLEGLHRADPGHYLLSPWPEEMSSQGRSDGWRLASDLAEVDTWGTIGPAYGCDIGAEGRLATVVGGSCALQGYAWRIASLSIGRWCWSGEGIALRSSEIAVRLRQGRTVDLALGRRCEVGPRTPTEIAADLVDHLSPVVLASRSVSRLRAKVAWGNVASAVASAWRYVADGVPRAHTRRVRVSAERCLNDAVWPWPDPPITWSLLDTEIERLIYHRHTCCLMRLAPGKKECGACSLLTAEENEQGWRTREITAVQPELPLPEVCP